MMSALILTFYIRAQIFLLEHHACGVIFMNVIPTTPAEEIGLTGIIKEINGQKINNMNDLSNILNGIMPNQKITIVTSEGSYELNTISNPNYPNKAFIGIGNVSTKWC